MEKKILLQDLADALVDRKHLGKKEADTFVRTFFEVITAALESDKMVKIKGFGTFKLVEVNPRESVNVATGERIEIQGHSKISFVPDATLRDIINKPFADFETVAINEGTDLAAMENVVDEPFAEELGTTVESPEATTYAAEKVDAHTTAEEPVNEPVPVQEAENTDVAEEIPAPAVKGEPETPANESGNSTVSETEKSDKITQKPATATPQSAVGAIKIEEQKAEHQPVEHQYIMAAEKSEKQVEKVQGVSWTKASLVASLIFLLMLGSYFAGYYNLLSPERKPAATTATIQEPQGDAPATTVETETVSPPIAAEKRERAGAETSPSTNKKSGMKPDIISTQSKSAQTVTSSPEPLNLGAPNGSGKAANSYPQLKGGQFEIIGTHGTHIIKEGETLCTISVDVYGKKDYVPYIVLFNKIENPDHVEKNTVLKLPELRKRK